MITILEASKIKEIINKDFNSRAKSAARMGQRYYEGKHDILNYKIYYYTGGENDTEGKLVEDKMRSNIKIPHQFFTELVDQCVHYLLSGSDNGIVTSDDLQLKDYLSEYFGDEFIDELADVLTDVCVNGFGYMYAYMTADGRIKFTYADSMGVAEVMAKDTDDKTDYVIYWYIDRVDNDKTVKRIQVWDNKQVNYFCQVNDGAVAIDESEPINPRPHVVYTKPDEEGTFGSEFGFIPFFRMDSSRKQTSHLAPVKALIDDYDLMACGLSNNLQDIADGIYVVKGFEGDSLDTLQQNLKNKKIIGLPENGDVDIRTISISYEARKVKLDLDEKNIYHFGMGFNPSQLGDGNITNVVIKSRYTLLELKSKKLEGKLRAFLKKLIQVALDEINRKHETDYRMKDVKINLKREIITNELDNAQIELTKAQTKQAEVNVLLSVAATLGDENIVEKICEVLDIDYDEIKDKLPNDDLADAQETLEQVAVDE